MLLQSTWKTLVSSFRMLSLILTIYNGTIMVICALVKCKPFHYRREISKAFFTIQLPFKNWSVNSKPAKYRLSKSFVPSRGSNFEKVDIIFAKWRNSNGSRRGRQFAFAKLFKKRKKKDLVLIWSIILCGKNTKITTINDTIVKCHTSSPIMANKRISKIYFRVLNKDVRADYKNCANGINNENGIARSGFNETEKETRVRLKKRFMQSRHAAVFVVTFVWELKSSIVSL